jgi:hypothetical protein
MATTNTNTNSPADTITKLNYAVLGTVSALALGYGGYEYRQDLVNVAARIRRRFPKTKLK